MIPVTYYLPLYFQSLRLQTPLLSAVSSALPYVFAFVSSTITAGIYMQKTGRYRIPIFLAAISITLGVGLMVDFTPETSWAEVIFAVVIFGFGVGVGFQAPLMALHALVQDERDIATATATMLFLRTVGMAIFLVVFQSLFSNVLASQDDLIRSALPPDLAIYFVDGNAAANVDRIRSTALSPAQKVVVKDAFRKGLRAMWILGAVMSGIMGLLSFGIGKKELTSEHEAVQTGLRDRGGRNGESNRGVSSGIELEASTVVNNGSNAAVTVGQRA